MHIFCLNCNKYHVHFLLTITDFHYRCEDLKLFILRLHSTNFCVRQENPKLKVSEGKYSFQGLETWKHADTSLMITDKIPLYNDFRIARTRDMNGDRKHTDGSLSGISCSGMLQNWTNYLHRGAQSFFRNQQFSGYSKNYPRFTESEDSILLHGYTVHQWYQTLYSPTNAHVEFIKTN